MACACASSSRSSPSGYVVTLTPQATLNGTPVNPAIDWGPGLGDEIARSAGSGGFFSGTYVYPAEGFVYRDGDVTRYAGAAAATAGPQQGAFRFFGIDDHYFVAAVVDAPGSQRVDVRAPAARRCGGRARRPPAGGVQRRLRRAAGVAALLRRAEAVRGAARRWIPSSPR